MAHAPIVVENARVTGFLDYNTRMAPKKHFYTVVKGRRPGIYTQWTGPGGAEEQVKGYPGAVFQGFATREEAEAYRKSGGKSRGGSADQSADSVAQPALLPADPVKAAPPALPRASASRAAAPRAAAARTSHLAELEAGKVVIFTDGASTGNPGPGGYGAVVLVGDERKELAGGFRCTTNNRMELMGVIAALESLDAAEDPGVPPAPAALYSDSRYVVDAVQKGWARRWKANGWMRARDAAGKINRAENVDLWERVLDLLDRRAVEFHWVRGHASNPENERCDWLAVQAAKGRSLPKDPGFEGTCR